MAELKPCPFCGGEEIQFNIQGYFQPWEGVGMRLWYSAACHDCGCVLNEGGVMDMKKAAELWNRRVSDGSDVR